MTSANCGPVGAASIFSPIGTLGNPYCALVGGTTTAAAAGTGSSYTNDSWNMLHKDNRASDDTILGWEPSRFFGAHAGFRYATRTVAYGDFTTGTTTNLSANGKATQVASGDASNVYYPDTDHEKAGLFGIKLRPRTNWMINGDVELSYVDHPVVAIMPGHSQDYKLRSTYRFAKWGSIAGFINDKLSRNSYFSSDFALAEINTNPVVTGTPVWKSDPLAPVRHSDHNFNYGFSASLHPNEKVTLDFGWTYQDLFSTTGSCLPMTVAIVPEGGQISRCPAAVAAGTAGATATDSEGDPYNPSTGFNGVPAILHYQQNTNTGYVNMILQPVKRVSVLLGYEITSDSGDNTWLRADTLAPFMVPVDAAGNVIYAGNTLSGARVGYAPGPNPAVGPGPLGLNWHLPSVGVELGLTRNLAFKGMWRYYDYHEKSDPGTYIAARDFQANTGTLSLRYSF
jgi:opacity protein-like surface antigen